MAYGRCVTPQGSVARVDTQLMRNLSRTIIILTALAVVVSSGPVASAGPTSPKARALRATMFQLVNGSRRHHDLQALDLNTTLSRKAWRHSKRMAARYRVYHTTGLYSLVRRYNPSAWGENVGMAGTLKRMEVLFMRSAPHRANILSHRFRHIGVGVVRARERIWVTLDFYGG
jgi:uncharacterized protein YkwD